MSNIIIIIMAGGTGKRMNSDIPKVLHKVGQYPMLYKIIMQARAIQPLKILVVVGQYFEIIKKTLASYTNLNDIKFVIQNQALGTGHAVKCCMEHLNQYPQTKTLILSGDVPLITSETLLNMISNFNLASIMVSNFQNPYGYGRIIEKNGIFNKITEQKDCSEEEKLIQKINCGVYAFNTQLLSQYISLINNNNCQNEYYLTDIIEIIKNNEKINIELFEIPFNKQIEIMGVNTPQQLMEINEKSNE